MHNGTGRNFLRPYSMVAIVHVVPYVHVPVGSTRSSSSLCAVSCFLSRALASGAPRASARISDFLRPAALAKANVGEKALHRPTVGLANFSFGAPE